MKFSVPLIAFTLYAVQLASAAQERYGDPGRKTITVTDWETAPTATPGRGHPDHDSDDDQDYDHDHNRHNHHEGERCPSLRSLSRCEAIEFFAVDFIRMYTVQNQKHYFTTHKAEVDDVATNWKLYQEGVEGRLLSKQFNGSIPIWHYWSPTQEGPSHIYTNQPAEFRDALLNAKAIGYDTPGYVFTSPVCGTIPLYSFYNPVKRDHWLTVDEKERDKARRDPDVIFKGRVGYVFPSRS